MTTPSASTPPPTTPSATTPPPTTPPPTTPPPGDGNGEPSPHDNNWRKVQNMRAVVSFLIIGFSVAGISYVSYWGISHAATAKDASPIVAILSSAFTAIATMATAYFGIRAATNAAQSATEGKPAGGKPGGGTP